MAPKKMAPRPPAESLPKKAPPPKIGSPSTTKPSKKTPVQVKGKPRGGKLFQAYEQLLQIETEENKARRECYQDETLAFQTLVFHEQIDDLCALEGVERGSLVRTETVQRESEVLFEFMTGRQAIEAAARCAQLEAQQRKVSGRLQKKASDVQAERAHSAKRRNDGMSEGKGRVDPSRVAEEASEEHERRLKKIDKITQELAEVEMELRLFESRAGGIELHFSEGSPRRVESQRVVDQRRNLLSRIETLQKRLEKLHELERRYVERRRQEAQRMRRASSLRVDTDVLAGKKNLLDKIKELDDQAIVRAHEEVLDEVMFRKMMQKTGQEFYEELKEHQSKVDEQWGSWKALHSDKTTPAPPHGSLHTSAQATTALGIPSRKGIGSAKPRDHQIFPSAANE
jgi:hypothetical protein